MPWDGRIRADARHLPITSESVQCCVTSPPYWGLRKYDVDGPQIGSEETPAEWLAVMVEVFREVRRVLRPDGVCWVNIGDSYCHGTGADRLPTTTPGDRVPASWSNRSQPGRIRPTGNIKPKDLCLMPQRLAIALQDDGWYVRAEIIWAKGNCMPESVTDRPTRSHEQIWLLSKSARYSYDADAIKEPAGTDTHARYARGRSKDHKYADGGPGNQTLNRSMEHMVRKPSGWQECPGAHDTIAHNSGPDSWKASKFHDGKNLTTHPNVGKNRSEATGRMGRGAGWRERLRDPGVNPKAAEAGSGIRNNDSFSAAVKDVVEMRNKRTVWNINSKGYPEAHYATFPEEIPEICIKAGSKPGDLIMDCFGGSGTVAKVAERLGRRWVICDLGYQDLQGKRLRNIQREICIPFEST